MKKICIVVCLAIYIQTCVAQNFIHYNGRSYDKSVLTIKDSIISFHPVDEKKIAAVGGVSGGNITIPVSIPNYPGDHYRCSNAMAIYPTLTIKNVEVEDTAANQRKVDAKRQYADYRLKVVQAVKAQIESIKALQGKTLTDKKDIFVFKELMEGHSDIWANVEKTELKKGIPLYISMKKLEKEKEKMKVGKNCMNAIPIYMKKLDEEETMLQSFLSMTDRRQILETTITSNGCTGDGMEMGNALDLPSPIEQHDRVAYNYAHYKEYFSTKKIDITIKNPLLADAPVTVFNPWYEGVGAVDWKWLQDFYKNGGLEHIVESFPKEKNYYKSEQYPDYRFHYNGYYDGDRLYVLDRDENLIGVSVNYNNDVRVDEVIKGATMLYDLENNAYNIKSESNGVQRWAYYLINKKLGINTEPNYDEHGLGMLLGAGFVINEMENLQRLYAYRKITKAEYNKKMSELNEKAQTLNKKADAVSKKYPSKAEMERAEKFVKQLESDYNKAELFSNVHIERLNGIQFMLVSDDRKLKVLKTYSLDVKGKLKASYVTLKKN